MPRKKTHEEYEQELFEREIDLFPLEKYINCRTPILHECINKHQRKVLPASVLLGSGCKICADISMRKTHSKYISELKAKGIKHYPVGEYQTDKRELKHQCPEGHTWMAIPSNILRGTGCPVCNKMKNLVGGYNLTRFKRDPILANSPGVLYLVALINIKTHERECLKIGITKGSSYKSVARRATGFIGYEHRVLKIVKGTLMEVFILEQQLHEKWSHKQYRPLNKFAGHTELFEVDPEIIRSVPKTI